MTSGPSLVLNKEDFLTLSTMVNERSGMLLGDTRQRFMATRVAYRMKMLNLNSVQDYLYYLKYDPSGHEETQALLEAVAINETYFMREREHFEALTNEVLPQLTVEHKRHGRLNLRLWSAGCSTGEEAYSLAALVMESVVGYSRWKVEVLGTDISNKALESARRGEYREHALREVSLRQLRRFFDKTNAETYRVKDELRESVHFGQVNLLDAKAVSKVGTFDVIFCRNVLMYMDETSKRKIIMNLYRALAPGGRLFVGKAETVRGLADMFEFDHWGSVVYYRKPALVQEEPLAV